MKFVMNEFEMYEWKMYACVWHRTVLKLHTIYMFATVYQIANWYLSVPSQ